MSVIMLFETTNIQKFYMCNSRHMLELFNQGGSNSLGKSEEE